MSWLPTFEIGVWNAWILMLYFPLQPLLLLVVDKAVGDGQLYKKMGEAPTGKREKRNDNIYMAIVFLLIAYSIFLPLKAGTGWLIAGLAIYFLGLAILLTAIINVAATPPGQPYVKGMYRFSRHPIYLAIMIMHAGVGIASASWIFLLFSAILIILQISRAVAEERGCLETYGKDYKEYMNRTPRWIGIPKSR
jgi:protein-S-isoprenylcysteine O-methyltransferase Ste14